LAPLAALTLPAVGEFVCYGRDDRELVVASLRGRCLLHLRKGEKDWELVDAPLSLARPATAMCRSSDGHKVYFTATSPQVGGEQAGNHFSEDTLLTLDLENWEVVSTRSTQLRHGLQPLAGAIDSGCGATSVAPGLHNDLLVAFSGTHEVARVPLGEGLDYRIDFSDRTLYCPGSLVALDSDHYLATAPAQGTLIWLNDLFEIDHVERINPEPTPQDPAWLRQEGEICFYEAANAGISCQSCHPHGGCDYAAHDIGGASQWGSLSVSGIADTSPYLRTGSYPGMGDLHTVALTEYRGYRRDSPASRAHVLESYLEAIPLPVNPRQFLEEPVPLPSGKGAAGAGETRLEKERRGLQAFIKGQCVSCHALPATTNLACVPNQSLFPNSGLDYYETLDVPSLRGVWQSAPYLHDQRAAKLEDVLTTQNRADRHGRVSLLNPTERGDLVEFLLSL
jgi:hypothetical protein